MWQRYVGITIKAMKRKNNNDEEKNKSARHAIYEFVTLVRNDSTVLAD